MKLATKTYIDPTWDELIGKPLRFKYMHNPEAVEGVIVQISPLKFGFMPIVKEDGSRYLRPEISSIVDIQGKRPCSSDMAELTRNMGDGPCEATEIEDPVLLETFS